MKGKFFSAAGWSVFAILCIAAALAAAPGPGQAGASDDQAYAGKWVGTFGADGGGTGNVAITLGKDDKGEWQGSVKYSNQDGEQSANFKSLQFSGGKFKAKFNNSENSVEITLEGEFKGNEFAGTYSVAEKDSAQVIEKGTWKTTKS